MNLENFKTSLLEMIKEADNLPASEIEGIPGTSILVKKGRTDEFTAAARYYYELKNNQFAAGNFLEEVYQELREELLNEEEEHDISKAYDLYTANESDLTRLGYLNKSLEMNLSDQEKYRKSINDLNSRISDLSVREEIVNLQKTLESLADSELRIKNDIAEIKDKVNGNVRKAVEEEMQFLKDCYANTRFGTATDFGLDGTSILASDKEVYDNLYILLKIIDNVNEKDPIVAVDSTLCVNPHQIDAVRELLPKINFLNLVYKKKEELKDTISLENNPNEDLIKEVLKEIDKLYNETMNIARGPNPDETLLEEYKIQLVKYTMISFLLVKAAHSKNTLTQVWNAYVDSEDERTFENFIKDLPLFQKYNPELKKLEENQKLIRELKEHLKDLENKVTNYQGLTNPSLTKIGDKVLLSEDAYEYHNTLAIIHMLENSKERLIPVKEGGYVFSDYLTKYKELIQNSKYFNPSKTVEEPQKQDHIELDFTANEEMIEKLKAEMKTLEIETTNHPGEEKSVDAPVLKSDEVEYMMLNSLVSILNSAKTNNPVKVGELYLPDGEGKNFATIMDTIAKLREAKNKSVTPEVPVKETTTDENSEQGSADEELTPTTDATTNIADSTKVNEEEKRSPVDLMFNLNMLDIIQEDIMRLTNNEPEKLENVASEDLEEYTLLVEQQMILKSVKPTSELIQVGSVYVPKDLAERYKEIVYKLVSIKQAKEEAKQKNNNNPSNDHGKSDSATDGVQNADYEEIPEEEQEEKHRFKTRKSKKRRGKKAIKCIVGAGLVIWLSPALFSALVAIGATPLGVAAILGTLGGAGFIWKKFKDRKYEDVEPGLIRGSIQDMIHNIKDMRSQEVVKEPKEKKERIYTLNNDFLNQPLEYNQTTLNKKIEEDAKKTRETKIMNGIAMDQDVDEVLVEIPNLEEILGSDHFTR